MYRPPFQIHSTPLRPFCAAWCTVRRHRAATPSRISRGSAGIRTNYVTELWPRRQASPAPATDRPDPSPSSPSRPFIRYGITSPRSDPRPKNAAVVIVTPSCPPSRQAGQAINMTVSSIGEATPCAAVPDHDAAAGRERPDLRDGAGQPGGRPLRPAGKDRSRMVINIPSDGRLPKGATSKLSRHGFD